jgi:transposase
MLDVDQRTAILELAKQGRGTRAIARALGIGRNTVRRVVRSGRAEVPKLERPEQLAEHVALVTALHGDCDGNLVRVAEELCARDIETSYPALTAFCRRNGIGVAPKQRVGRYDFAPGEEMQHDTSPHKPMIGGRRTVVQLASLVLCYSRRMYAQAYERWSRFECRVFLTEAIEVLGGSANRCMIDNASIIIAHGRGKDAVAADAMLALGRRFGFVFEAHEVGDADRSGRVERPFRDVERNFYAGRTFETLADLNAQLRQWCEARADKHRRELGATPRQLWVAERPALHPLPLHIPEVYEVHTRRVDVEGYVNLHTNRYSVPTALIGRTVTIRESIDRVRVFDGHAVVTEHERRAVGARVRVTKPEHLGERRWRQYAPQSPEEQALRASAPALGAMVDALRKRHGGQALRAVRRLHRLWRDYPTEPVVDAVKVALEHRLLDLSRLEQMVLRRIAGEFFRLPTHDDEPPDEPEDDDER